MLLATPYVPFDSVQGSGGPPRVISEIRKQNPIVNRERREQIRPRISGDLLVICGNEKRWWPRRVMVRGGQLLIGSVPGDSASSSLRLPLRHLSLAAGPLPHSLSLYKGQNIALTIQTASERAFDLWVKTIAIELIRQTPLEAVRYLDILTLADCWNKKYNQEDCTQDWNCNYIKNEEAQSCNYYTNEKQKTKVEPKSFVQPPPSDERSIEVLLKKCQNADNYVPVKEKLVLFESLCRFGRKVRSTEDVSVKISVEAKRAVSMHDLSNSCLTGVRQICKYFENKREPQEELSSSYGTIHRASRRLINFNTQLRDRNIDQRTENLNEICSV